MDPQEALRLLSIALLEENTEAVLEHYWNLKNWMRRGGFEPAWTSLSRRQFDTINPFTGRIE